MRVKVFSAKFTATKLPDAFFTMPPLGACLIATSLKNAGFKVKLAHNPLFMPEETASLAP